MQLMREQKEKISRWSLISLFKIPPATDIYTSHSRCVNSEPCFHSPKWIRGNDPRNAWGWQCACKTMWLEMLHRNLNTLRYSHVHVRLPGSGVHNPLDAQVAVILVAGTNIGLHLNEISAPSVVFWYGSIEPSVGGVGSPQLTGGGITTSYVVSFGGQEVFWLGTNM